MLRFEHLQVDLPYFSPTSIVQDHQGFLWIGTLRGLYKYDGYQFTSYRVQPRFHWGGLRRAILNATGRSTDS